jgi:hypothetical protein
MGEGDGGSRGSGRFCAYAGCTTRLSVYNSDFLCWTHADMTTRASFERKTARHAALLERESRELASRGTDTLWIGDFGTLSRRQFNDGTD